METRVLVFPEDVQVGWVDVHLEGAWLPRVAARGNVSVPTAGEACLTAFPPFCGLGALQPDDIHSLEPVKRTATDEGVARMAHLTGLRRLRLSKSHAVTDAGLAHLARLRRLRELDLYWTGVGDAGLEHLAGLVHLRDLHLGLTRVQGPGLRLLSGLQWLEWLSLEDTDVDDSVVPHLGALRALRTVALWGTRMSTRGIAELQASLPAARIVTRQTGKRLARERSRAALLRILARRLGLPAEPGEETLAPLLSGGAEIDWCVGDRSGPLWRPAEGFDTLAALLGRLHARFDLRVLTADGRVLRVPWLRARRRGRRAGELGAGLRTSARSAARLH
jgi:hypothetical protein